MTSMYEKELRWTILFLLWSLWFIESGEIPYHYSAIVGWRSEKVALHSWKFNVVNILCVASQTKKFTFYISCIPNSYSCICRTSNHQVLIKRWAINTHYLLNMTFYWNWWSLSTISDVPNFKLFIVSNRNKLMLVKVIPTNILHNWTMSILIIESSLLILLIKIGWINIPTNNFAVIWARKQKTFL